MSATTTRHNFNIALLLPGAKSFSEPKQFQLDLGENVARLSLGIFVDPKAEQRITLVAHAKATTNGEDLYWQLAYPSVQPTAVKFATFDETAWTREPGKQDALMRLAQRCESSVSQSESQRSVSGSFGGDTRSTSGASA